MLNRGHGRKVAQTLENNLLPVSGKAITDTLMNRTKLYGAITDIGTYTLNDSIQNYKKIGVIVQAGGYHQKEVQFAVEDIVINQDYQFINDISWSQENTSFFAGAYFNFTANNKINVTRLSYSGGWHSAKIIGVYGYKQY